MEIEYIPASKKTVYIPANTFATIVCLIPYGNLTTYEAIMDMWAKREGGDMCQVDGPLPIDKSYLFSPANIQRVDSLQELAEQARTDEKSDIPYWRIISQTGALIDFGVVSDKESQIEQLKQEGHTIVMPNPLRRLYRVKDYKASLFDLSKLIFGSAL